MSVMDIKSVLIEKEDRSSLNVLSSSGILIEKKYVITTSNILDNFFQENLEILNTIQAGRLHMYKGQNKLSFRIIWKDDNETLLESKKANIFGLFKCKNIEEFCKNQFKDWTVDLKENNFNCKNLTSVFLIFATEDENVCEEEFKSMLQTWLLNISSIRLNKSDRIICRSCPFGTRDFLNSLSEGIISNTFNKSLSLSDCSATPGCEGGIVYSMQNSVLPVGIIVSSLNWWRKEWSGFTLIANIQPILCQIVGLDLVYNNSCQINPLKKLLDTAENSLVQINCGVDWGTCVLLSKEQGLFITNSHVVRFPDLNIRLFWKNKIISASLIYKVPDNSVFDLAIVKCNEDLSFMSSCVTTITTYKTGDTVYCAGYPLLSTLSKPEGVTITHGIISDCNSYMIKTTCGVFPGFSGGAVFNYQGVILGIIVCNTRLADTNVTYPKINMAVPYKAIVDVISEYIIKSSDHHILTKLRTFDPEAIRMWTRLEGKL